VNAYSYCWNSPIALEDAEGTTPQISIDLSALQPLLEDTAELIKTGISKLTENIQKLMSKYNDFLDKLEFNINHPDVVINNGLSKILGREVSIKFPLINAIRAYFGTFDIRTGELVGGAGDGYHTSDSDNEENGIAPYGYINSDDKTNNWFEVVVKVLTFGIEADYLSRLFEAFMQAFNPLFDFNTWYESLSVFFQDLFSDLIIDGVSAMNTIFLYFFDQFAQDLTMTTVNFSIGKLIEKIPSKYASSLFDVFNVFKSIDENFEDYHLIEYSFILTFLDIGLFYITISSPGLAIPLDMTDDLIKKVFLNLDSGRLWG